MIKKYLAILLLFVSAIQSWAVDRNVAGQKFTVIAIDSATGRPKTGDAGQITAYVSKDDGSVTVLADTSATEDDSTNAKGAYTFDAAQGETDAIKLKVTGKSSTSGIDIIPQIIYTLPAGLSTLTIANNATAANTTRWNGTAVSSPATAGIPDINVKNVNNVSASSVTTINANVGTTQPLNFTGTSTSALVKGDALDINSVAASSVTTINANLGTTQPINFTGTGSSAYAKSDVINIGADATTVTNLNTVYDTYYTLWFDATNKRVKSDVMAWNATAVASPNVAGYPLVDTGKWLGGTIPAVNTTGVPLTDTKYIGGTLQTAGDIYGAFNPRLAKTIYVETTGNDSNAGTTAASPKLTINGAIAAMSDGDTCQIGSGTFAKFTCTLKHVKFIGAGKIFTTVSTASGTAALITLTQDITIRNMTLTSTDTAVRKAAVDAEYSSDVTLESCDCNGVYDSVFFKDGYNVTIKGCVCTGQYDGLNAVNTVGIRASDSVFYTNGNYATVNDAGVDNYRGAVLAQTSLGIFQRCKFVSVQPNATAHVVAAVVTGYDAQTAATFSESVFDDCVFDARATHASNTGKVFCLGNFDGNELPLFAHVYGGRMSYSNAGSGASHHIRAQTSGSRINALHVKYDQTAAFDNSLSQIVTDLAPVTPNRSLVVDANGLVDATAVKVGPSGSATAQAAGDIPTLVSTVNTKIGTPASSLSADIATRLATSGYTTPPTAAAVAAATLAATNGSATVAVQLQHLDGDVSDAAADFDATQKAQILAALSIGEDIGVPKNLTWVVARKDGDIKATAIIPKDSGEEVDVAVDFRGLLGSSDAIKSADHGGIVSVDLVTTGTGLIDSPAFDDVDDATLWMNSAVRFHITGGTTGTTYTVRVKVLTVGGNTYSATCQMKVTGS